MYQTILIPLDTTAADEFILKHIRPLAKLFHSKLVLLHVADGWAARALGPDAISPEITEDQAYLSGMRDKLKAEGFEVDAQLAYGEPSTEIVRWVNKEHCDLIAMSTHGHRFLADLFLGATAHAVQHRVDVPVLLLRMPEKKLVKTGA